MNIRQQFLEFLRTHGMDIRIQNYLKENPEYIFHDDVVHPRSWTELSKVIEDKQDLSDPLLQSSMEFRIGKEMCNNFLNYVKQTRK